jgi:uncharacterized protein YjdB
MKNKLKSLKVKKIISLIMCITLVLNLGVSNYFIKEVNAAVAEDPNRELTIADIPDAVLFAELLDLVDTNKDGKLIIQEINAYTGDSNGILDLSNKNLTNIKGLGYAKGVKAINLSSNSKLDNIPENAFIDCKNLVSIILPDGITSLGNSAFEGCTSLKDIILPNGVSNIGEKCFFQCTSLTNIVLPTIITTIGGSAFSGSGLTSIEIPNPKVSIGVNCFNGCGSLRNVILPEGMESIPMGCFTASGVKSINIPKSIKTIEEAAFSSSALNYLDLSMCTSLTSIKTSAFSGSAIYSIILPESLTELGSRAFENCTLLPQITIPSKITIINELTFSKCSNLENLTFTPSIVNGIPKYNLQEIGALAFNQCTSLGGVSGNVEFLKDLKNLSKIGDQAFMFCSGKQGVEKDEYGQQIYYGIQGIILPENLSQIGKEAFSNCSTLKAITIPNKVTIVEDKTFLNCYDLETVTLSNATTKIGANSFESCNELNNINFPESLVEIGSNAFLNCASEKVKTIEGTTLKEYIYTGIDTLVLPDKIINIGSGAFKGCFNLNTVKLPVNLTKLEASVFQDCARQLRDSKTVLIANSYKGLKAVVFPENLNSIDIATFKNCYNLDLVNGALPNSISTIGANSFENCKSLTSVVIPYKLEKIGISAFSNCNLLKNIDFTYAANLKEIGATAFTNIIIEGILRLPETLRIIGSGAFTGCKGITSVDFPDGLTSIGSLSFSNCSNIESITLPAAATVIYTGTIASFYGCEKLNNAIIKAVPGDIPIMENSKLRLPVNCFSEINTVEVGNENIATAEITYDNLLKPQVSLNGIKTGETTITIKGTIEYITGKDPLSGANMINMIQTQVQFNAIVSAIKCTEVKLDKPVRGLKLSNTAGITLNPILSPVNTTDVKKWTSDNLEVATVSDTGIVKPVGYGTAIITVTVGDQEARCIVNVCAPANVFTLDKSSGTVVIGDQLPIKSNISYSAAFSELGTIYPDVVVWSSSDPNIATVDGNGNVKAIASGIAVITARADAAGLSKTCTVTVIPEITDVSFDKKEMTLIKGSSTENTKTITMTLNPSDSPLSKIKVTPSNTTVASVSVSGNIITITAKLGGTVTITATPVNGKAATCIVTVKAPLTSMTASPINLNKGDLRTIAITKTPTDTTDKIVYSSDNNAIATVDSTGKVTGVNGGTAIITMKSESGLVSATCVVTVSVLVSGVTFANTSTTLIKNSKIELGKIVSVQPSNATNKALAWSSSNPSVASVDANGVVTAIANGTAKIIAKTVVGSYVAYYTVNVNLPTFGGKSIDINNDEKIDIIDFALVANGYNSTMGSSIYNVKFDFTSDNIIDIYDMVLVRKYIS